MPLMLTQKRHSSQQDLSKEMFIKILNKLNTIVWESPILGFYSNYKVEITSGVNNSSWQVCFIWCVSAYPLSPVNMRFYFWSLVITLVILASLMNHRFDLQGRIQLSKHFFTELFIFFFIGSLPNRRRLFRLLSAKIKRQMQCWPD